MTAELENDEALHIDGTSGCDYVLVENAMSC